MEKLTKLETRLYQIAKKCALMSPEHDIEDMYQYIYSDLLERSLIDESFLDQTDSYIVKYAYFMGTNRARKSRIYLKIVSDNESIEPEEGPEPIRKNINNFSRHPESEVIRFEILEALEQSINQLSESNKKIIELLYLGYKKSDIASLLNVSKPAITLRLSTIRKTLTNSMALCS